MNALPLHDKIIVRPSDAEDVTPGGIVLPDKAKEKPSQGRVMAVGPGKMLDNGKRGQMSVKVGNTVMYGKYSALEIDIHGNEMVIMPESEVLCILENV